MKCVGELLDREKYGVKGKIAIIENKKAIMKVFGLNNDNWLNIWNIDSRILTLFYKSYDLHFDWFIVVYDYEAFCADQDIKEAIIWHELGHIQFPVLEHQVNLDCEIQCDRLASKNGHKEGMRKVLDLTLKMAQSLNNELLTNYTNERRSKLFG